MAANVKTATVLVPGLWAPGQEYTALAYLDIADSIETGDTITVNDFLPEQGIIPLDFEFWGVDLDSDASPTATIKFGTATDDDAFLTASTAGATGNPGQLSLKGNGAGLGVQLDSTTTIYGIVGGTVATAATTGRDFIKFTYRCVGVR